jgi:hypothetical protein
MGRILRKLRSLYRGDHAVEGGQRQLENTDALSATANKGADPSSGMGHAGAPVGWVKTDDERPQH